MVKLAVVDAKWHVAVSLERSEMELLKYPRDPGSTHCAASAALGLMSDEICWFKLHGRSVLADPTSLGKASFATLCPVYLVTCAIAVQTITSSLRFYEVLCIPDCYQLKKLWEVARSRLRETIIHVLTVSLTSSRMSRIHHEAQQEVHQT